MTNEGWIEYNAPLRSAGTIKTPGLTISMNRKGPIMRLNGPLVTLLGSNGEGQQRYRLLVNRKLGMIGVVVGDGPYEANEGTRGQMTVKAFAQCVREIGVAIPADVKFVMAIVGKARAGERPVACFDLSKWWKNRD